jgi:zinc transporter ZupT
VSNSSPSLRLWTFGLGLALAIGGLVGSLLTKGTILDLNPGVLGAFSATVMGILLATFEGCSYPRIVMVGLPVAAWQVATPALSTPGILAQEVLILGVIGLVLASRMRASDPAPAAPRPASRGAERTEHAVAAAH